jgi:protein-disulfide isomerase
MAWMERIGASWRCADLLAIFIERRARVVHWAGVPTDTTLVLFWSPECGFCQRMLDDLKGWETNPQPGAPQLLVVSRGTVAANQAQGLRSPVVLDQGFTVGRAFGATGTPMAVLVDGNRKIASEVVAGAQAILALAEGEQAGTQPATASRSPSSEGRR